MNENINKIFIEADEEFFEDFNIFLKTIQKKSITTRLQYCAETKRIHKFLKENNKEFNIKNIQKYTDNYKSISSKIKMMSIIKVLLIYLKSPLIFEIDNIIIERGE